MWRRRSEEAEVAIFKGQIRNTLSLVAVKAQARLLLDRLRGLGKGVEVAEERQLLRERKAHQLCLRQGRGVRARGQYLISPE